jgi:predicted oxidoreductase
MVILNDGPSVTYSASRFRYLLGVWCARHHRPFTIVDDDELVEIFRMLYERVEIPSRITVSRDIQEMFQLSRRTVTQVLVVSEQLFMSPDGEC